MPPKKAANNELNVILVDVNGSANDSALSNVAGCSDFDICASIADSLICRNIFANSPEHFNSRNGHPKGIYVAPKERETASFDLLETLDDVKPGTENAVPLQDAIKFACEYVEKMMEESIHAAYGKINVFLLSNLGCSPIKMLTKKSAGEMANRIAQTPQMNVTIVSPDDVLNEKSPKSEFCFDHAQKRFGPFIAREKMGRGMPFDLQLSETSGIKVQMYKKNDDAAKIEMLWKPCNVKDGTEYKKIVQHVTAPEVQASMDEVDRIPDREFREGRFQKAKDAQKVVERGDLIKGFYYGKTITPVDDAMKQEFLPAKGSKEMALVMFTKKENILPQFILSGAQYLLPQTDAEGSQTMFSELVKEMLEQDVVAIARYAYNAAANKRIVCLIPKITKSKMPVLIHYVLPHGEDLRNFEFPPLVDPTVKEDEAGYEQDVMNDFVDNLMLVDEDGGNERSRPRDLLDPKIQRSCLLLRHKALNPTDTLPGNVNTDGVLVPLSMPAPSSQEEKEKRENVFAEVRRVFKLQINANTRHALFMGRQVGESVLSTQPMTQDEIIIKKSQA
ncbi:Ku domain-containing protein [Aphelenchoides fujianensis]|nr:Ku domain-containing protein [Aphelenchoides fujianensis]